MYLKVLGGADFAYFIVSSWGIHWKPRTANAGAFQGFPDPTGQNSDPAVRASPRGSGMDSHSGVYQPFKTIASDRRDFNDPTHRRH